MSKNPFTYLGTNEETLTFAQPADEAVSDIRDAFERIGTVVAFDAGSCFLRGCTRYGLQRVWFEILELKQETGSMGRVRSAADDVWGTGARRGLKKLLNALTEQGTSFHAAP